MGGDTMAIKYWVGAKAIIYNTKLHKILAVKRGFDDTSAGVWENPGGKKEVGEDIIDALKREVLEETGVEVNEYRYLYSSGINEERNPFFIEGYFVPTEKEDIELSFEHIEYKWLSVDEYLNIVDAGIRRDFKRANVLEIIKKYEK